MANIASAKKRARQAEKNRLQNTGFRSMFRTYLKRVVTEIEKGDKAAASAAYKAALPLIDKLANIISMILNELYSVDQKPGG